MSLKLINIVMEDRKLFDQENRIYKYYLNNVTEDKAAIEFIQALFKLELIEADRSEHQDLIQLYNIVGFDKFFEILAYFGGNAKTLKLPRIDKAKKLLITAIAYYQTVILNLPPKEAGRVLTEKLGVLNLKQRSIKSIVAKLQQEIEQLSRRTLKEELKLSKNRSNKKDFDTFIEDEIDLGSIDDEDNTDE